MTASVEVPACQLFPTFQRFLTTSLHCSDYIESKKTSRLIREAVFTMSAYSFVAYCRSRRFVYLLILFVTTSTGAGQVLPVTHAAVQATVNQTSSLFSYAYTISNDATNQARIARVTVDVTVPAMGATLSGAGLN